MQHRYWVGPALVLLLALPTAIGYAEYTEDPCSHRFSVEKTDDQSISGSKIVAFSNLSERLQQVFKSAAPDGTACLPGELAHEGVAEKYDYVSYRNDLYRVEVINVLIGGN